VNDTDAPDWLHRCCSDEISQQRNKTTPFTARDVRIFMATLNFEIRNSLGYNISVENACLNYRMTSICRFRQQKLLKITLYAPIVCYAEGGCVTLFTFLVHQRAEPG